MHYRKQTENQFGYIFLFSLGAIGIALLIISNLLNEDRRLLSRILFDLGMMFFPISIVGGMYTLVMRQEVERYFLNKANETVEVVFPEARQQKMRELIVDAKKSIIIVGNSPLYEFRNSIDWLSEQLSGLRSIKIAYLASDSSYVTARMAQSGGYDIRPQLLINHEIVTKLAQDPKIKNLEAIMYDLPPAEFFYIADDRAILATWYPFGEAGESCPCIFVDDLSVEHAQRLHSHYMKSLAFLKRQFGTIN